MVITIFYLIMDNTHLYLVKKRSTLSIKIENRTKLRILFNISVYNFKRSHISQNNPTLCRLFLQVWFSNRRAKWRRHQPQQQQQQQQQRAAQLAGNSNLTTSPLLLNSLFRPYDMLNSLVMAGALTSTTHTTSIGNPGRSVSPFSAPGSPPKSPEPHIEVDK